MRDLETTVVDRQVNTPGAQNAALKEGPVVDGDGFNPLHPAAAGWKVANADRAILALPDGVLKRKSIAICGFASSTRHYIANVTDDPAWELWTLNQFYRHAPAGPSKRGGRCDRHFDIHYNWDKEVVPGTDHRKWAAECGIPFYMMARQPDVPTSVTYPLRQLMTHFGNIDYFTSTIPYMLALAISEIDIEVGRRFREVDAAAGDETPLALLRSLYAEYQIGIFGIDLAVGGEYFHEKPCCEFWIGAAALGRGISVLLPPESALCKQAYRYGYDPEPKQNVTTKEIGDHKASIIAERDEQLKRLYMLEGAIQCDERWEQLATLRSRGATVS